VAPLLTRSLQDHSRVARWLAAEGRCLTVAVLEESFQCIARLLASFIPPPLAEQFQKRPIESCAPRCAARSWGELCANSPRFPFPSQLDQKVGQLAIFRAHLGSQHIANPLSQDGSRSARRNGNSQSSSLQHCGHNKSARLGVINNVDKHATSLSLFSQRRIDPLVIGRTNCQDGSVEIIGSGCTLHDMYSRRHGNSSRSDHHDLSTSHAQTLGLAASNLAAANDNTAATAKIEPHHVVRRTWRRPSRRARRLRQAAVAADVLWRTFSAAVIHLAEKDRP